MSVVYDEVIDKQVVPKAMLVQLKMSLGTSVSDHIDVIAQIVMDL